jgi:hypothetical protein
MDQVIIFCTRDAFYGNENQFSDDNGIDAVDMKAINQYFRPLLSMYLVSRSNQLW